MLLSTLFTFGSTGHMVSDKGAPLSHGPQLACGLLLWRAMGGWGMMKADWY